MSKELGEVLKTLRKNCELTQRQIAEVLHIDRSTYAYYERGTTEPDLKSILKIAKILNVDVELLLPDGDGKPSIKVSDITGDNRPAANHNDEDPMADMKDPKIYELSKDEQDFLVRLRVLDTKKQEKLMELLSDMQED